MTRRDILNHLWQSFAILPSMGSVASSATSVTRLQTEYSTCDFVAEHDIPEWLRLWQAQEMRPITETDCAIEIKLLQACLQHQKLNIIYHGGSHPGEPRSISPILLFAKTDFPAHYLLAWCHQREQARIFRIDAMTLKAKSPSP